MKTLSLVAFLVAVLFVAVTNVLGNSPLGLNYFNFEVYQKTDGTNVLQSNFFIYEDMSQYVGSASVHFDCVEQTFYIDEIVDVPENVVVNGVTYSQSELIGGIEYIASELVVYSTNQDASEIFPEFRPDSLYNDNHSTSSVNWQILNSFAQLNHTEICPELTTIYLPVIVK